MLSQQHTGW